MLQTLDIEAKGAEIALVAGEDGLSSAIAKMLEGDGYRCRRIAAEAFCARPDEMPADVLVIDTAGAGIAALDCCARHRHGHGAPRVLVVHGSGRAVDRRRASALGADGFLAKPFAMSDLRREIGRLLHEASG